MTYIFHKRFAVSRRDSIQSLRERIDPEVPADDVETHRNKRNREQMWEVRKVNEQARGPHVGLPTQVGPGNMEAERSKKMGEKMWDIRKVNEQVRSPHVGQQTKIGLDSDAIVTQKRAQQLASKPLNPQIRGGDVKREGAEISYFHPDNDRYAEPEALLQYEPESDTRSVIESDMDLSPFFHLDITKRQAEGHHFSCNTTYCHKILTFLVLLQEARGIHENVDGLFLVRIEYHGLKEKLCISVQSKGNITHHVLTNSGPGTEFSINCHPFVRRVVKMPECTTVPEVMPLII